jgi:hypothetical protein
MAVRDKEPDTEWKPYILPCGHTANEHESAKQAGAGYLSCDARRGVIVKNVNDTDS